MRKYLAENHLREKNPASWEIGRSWVKKDRVWNESAVPDRACDGSVQA